VRSSINVSILCAERPILKRFEAAREAGFGTVDLWWPRGADLAAVESAIVAAEPEVAAFNFDAGDMPAGDPRLISDPALQESPSNTGLLAFW
jgi:hydroxypyruvate isomerase